MLCPVLNYAREIRHCVHTCAWQIKRGFDVQVHNIEIFWGEVKSDTT